MGLLRSRTLVSCHCLREMLREVEARILEICPSQQRSANCSDFPVKSATRAKCAAGIFVFRARGRANQKNGLVREFPYSPLRAREKSE